MKFFKRPAHTLLYLHNEKLARIDANGKGIIQSELELFDVNCESSSSIPSAIDKFIDYTSKPLGRKVWVIHSRLQSYQLSLPSVQVEGVSPEILEQALQFEYEALTGESLSKSQLAYQFLQEVDEMSYFWINIIASETLKRLLDVLKDEGCQLGGLSHSGGLPNLLHKEEEVSNWLKLEYWENGIFAISKSPEDGLSLQIIQPQQNPNWRVEIDNWLDEVGKVEKSEALVTGHNIEFLPSIDHTYHLTPDKDLSLWMAEWLIHLVANSANGIPLLNAKQNVNKELIFMIGGGVAALLLCGSHLAFVLYKTNDYNFQIEKFTADKKNTESIQKTLENLQKEQTDLTAKKRLLDKNVKSIPQTLEALKNRPARLLKILAQHSPNDLLIEEIKLEEQYIVISGVSLQAQLSNQLADMIDEPLSDMGWKVNPPDKKSLNLFVAEEGPWGFQIVLEDKGLAGFQELKK